MENEWLFPHFLYFEHHSGQFNFFSSKYLRNRWNICKSAKILNLKLIISFWRKKRPIVDFKGKRVVILLICAVQAVESANHQQICVWYGLENYFGDKIDHLWLPKKFSAESADLGQNPPYFYFVDFLGVFVDYW